MVKSIIVVTAIAGSYLFGQLALFGLPDGHSTGVAPSVPAFVQDQEDEPDVKQAARQKFMQGKLDSNKKIVQGLTTNDFTLVQEGATEVSAYVKGQSWFVLDTPQYKSYSEDMRLAAEKLEKAAADRNIEAAALRYFELTVKCIDCHQYIEKIEY
jgi:hypothetical protein